MFPSRSDWKATLRPSGDHAGLESSALLSVSCVRLSAAAIVSRTALEQLLAVLVSPVTGSTHIPK